MALTARDQRQQVVPEGSAAKYKPEFRIWIRIDFGRVKEGENDQQRYKKVEKCKVLQCCYQGCGSALI
jgi:hypothetical protein